MNYSTPQLRVIFIHLVWSIIMKRHILIKSMRKHYHRNQTRGLSPSAQFLRAGLAIAQRPLFFVFCVYDWYTWSSSYPMCSNWFHCFRNYSQSLETTTNMWKTKQTSFLNNISYHRMKYTKTKSNSLIEDQTPPFSVQVKLKNIMLDEDWTIRTYNS